VVIDPVQPGNRLNKGLLGGGGGGGIRTLERPVTSNGFRDRRSPTCWHRERVFRWKPAEDVAQADNAGGVYQGFTRLSSQVTVSHRESGSFGATRDLR
jgi:hypothetical protein